MRFEITTSDPSPVCCCCSFCYSCFCCSSSSSSCCSLCCCCCSSLQCSSCLSCCCCSWAAPTANKQQRLIINNFRGEGGVGSNHEEERGKSRMKRRSWGVNAQVLFISEMILSICDCMHSMLLAVCNCPCNLAFYSFRPDTAFLRACLSAVLFWLFFPFPFPYHAQHSFHKLHLFKTQHSCNPLLHFALPNGSLSRLLPNLSFSLSLSLCSESLWSSVSLCLCWVCFHNCIKQNRYTKKPQQQQQQ